MVARGKTYIAEPLKGPASCAICSKTGGTNVSSCCMSVIICLK